MIVLNLRCGNGHAFEGWFASSDAFETQQAERKIDCPVCASSDINRLPSAPYVRTGTAAPTPGATPSRSDDTAALAVASLRQLAQKAEDVGKAFPAEVRRIHQGDAPDRSIRGQASIEEVAALLDEGIGVLPIPAAKEDLH
ncbi:MAG TPA: DUF1178 family protein [Denitromonas sp.]|uniref:DUF1178 family protein n=1 Tax=Denitromonas sp. TaxID=2734609 RepID=UPI001D999459|nr:DUF1178 family protein [Rhodocyclaceae bacterium]MCP5220360.1 DUF1178 family protein [Zoogloeaceae bacterium]HQU88172.1 DUF1178 family protein [Denitromonas sp.]HQV14238.1 DUF1178 family protein [Denitromonas sp.]